MRGEYAKMHRFLYEEERLCIDQDEWKASINQHVKNMEDAIRKINETRSRPDLDLLKVRLGEVL